MIAVTLHGFNGTKNSKLKAAKALSHPDERTPDSRPSARPVRILVVDDDETFCVLEAAVLELEGYEVVTSHNGADALERLASGKFDLVLTDRMMPVLDGASMILALRSTGSRIPVVMVSGSLGESPLPPGVAREVSAALPKPARMNEMLAAVARALKPGPGRKRPRR